MKDKSRIFLLTSALLLIAAGLFLYQLYISKYGLETTYYTITSPYFKKQSKETSEVGLLEEQLSAAQRLEKQSPEDCSSEAYSSTGQASFSLRIVQLTDLHNAVFGEENQKLIDSVASQSPDLILITGDLVNSKGSTDTSIAVDLIKHLSGIAPVYVSYGNQEDYLEKEKGIDIRTLYSNAGALVLDREYAEIEIKGYKLRIGGIYGYCQPAAYAIETQREEESDFLMDFQDTDAYTILMCHMPVSWLISGSLYDWDVDCVFSGHAHGGQVRLPFVGGLWAPDQGWFPGKMCGVYRTQESIWRAHRAKMLQWAIENGFDTSYYESTEGYKETNLVLSRGLGNTDWLPRFYNIPEIVVVDFIVQ